MKNFEELGLSQTLTQSLAKMEYAKPTPIQAQAIPLALDGHDIMGSAQTGTGKTAAFSIPLIEYLLANPKHKALVLTPTRELGKQIMEVMHQLLGKDTDIKTAFIIGGEPMPKQFKQLQANPRLIVGTPGRINDHLERGTLQLNKAHFLVLDETDRMLDMGFTVQLERIFKYMPEQRQTLMFSATLPQDILKMSNKYMNKPQRIAVGQTNVVATKIKQEVIRIEQDKKYPELVSQLHDRNGSVIVFVKTKYGADRMAKNLRRDGFTSEALHGDLRQNKRDKVMLNFRKQNFRVLIATDIAARGLDVPHIEHVVNYDLPQVAEDFIHRMGRTARAGAEGSAISFVSNQDGRKWHAIERLLDPNAKPEKGGAPDGRDRKRGKGRKRPDAKRRRSGGRSDEKSDRKTSKFKGRKSGGDSKSSTDDKKFGAKKSRPEGRSKPRSDDGDSESRKPSGKKKFSGKKTAGKKTFGKKPFGNKADGDKPITKKPSGKKFKSDGAKSGGGKFDKSFKSSKKSKPQGEKPQGQKRYKQK